MKSILLALTTYMVFLVGSHSACAETASQVRLLQQIRVAGSFDVDVEIKRTGATTFVLGTSSFLFNYNSLGMRAPSRPSSLIGPWSAGADLDYVLLTLTFDTTAGWAGLTVDFAGGDDDNGPTVPDTGFIRVGDRKSTRLNSSH